MTPSDVTCALARAAATLRADPDLCLIGEYLEDHRAEVVQYMLDSPGSELEARDDRLRLAATMLPPGRRARRLSEALGHYKANGWRRDRLSPHPPADPLRRLLWEALSLKDYALGERQLMRVLSDDAGL